MGSRSPLPSCCRVGRGSSANPLCPFAGRSQGASAANPARAEGSPPLTTHLRNTPASVALFLVSLPPCPVPSIRSDATRAARCAG